ncbi:SH2 domain-containing protein [Planoprotostelium fungivorum]|uniref:SH2 domain-containing protein n=1 Tax=Planoprotostelium fungivorum TaxID=1890364 RepID=A0A2P6N8U2_9EUKA|nr:SH2 domain-containing protein [Planoprotostelium fungivorum]
MAQLSRSNSFPLVEPLVWNPWVEPEEVTLEQPALGEGSFGIVYKGRLRGSTVAIKLLINQQLDDDGLTFFKREIQILGGLRAPNIVLFLGACCEPGHYMIITELMPAGDLDTILSSRKINLSLFIRMKMARDAAAGMCWLHQNKPQIFHRDLKPSNMLVDRDSYLIKLCDFGLAAVKGTGSGPDGRGSTPGTPTQSRKMSPMSPNEIGKHPAIGTPSWMAPEIMRSQPFTTKADVYSFGIVLWQLLTRHQPFAGLEEHTAIFDAVCNLKQRPKIPSNTIPALAALITRCWSQDPLRRPEFGDVIPVLDEIIVESAIENHDGSEFWKKHFLTMSEVPWSAFWNAFSEIIPEDTVTDDNVEIFYQLLGITPATSSNIEPKVHIENFGKVLSWLPGSLEELLPSFKKLCSQPWFFGFLDAIRAGEILSGNIEGTFLIRFSVRQPGVYTVSIVEHGTVTHSRISRESEEWVYDGMRDRSLIQLITKVKDKLKRPCPGSPYAITQKEKSTVYLYDE